MTFLRSSVSDLSGCGLVFLDATGTAFGYIVSIFNSLLIFLLDYGGVVNYVPM